MSDILAKSIIAEQTKLELERAWEYIKYILKKDEIICTEIDLDYRSPDIYLGSEPSGTLLRIKLLFKDSNSSSINYELRAYQPVTMKDWLDKEADRIKVCIIDKWKELKNIWYF